MRFPCRLRGEVGFRAKRKRSEGIRVRGGCRESEPVEWPPHPTCFASQTLRSQVDLSPQGAGESHMDLRGLLHWSARRILRATPVLKGESDGQVQEGFSTVAGPAGGQRETRSVGGAVHCSGGRAVRSGFLLGHGGLRPVQGRTVAAFYV